MNRAEYDKEWKRLKRQDPGFRLKAAEIQRAYYARNSEYKKKHRAYRLKTRYGITPEQYLELFEKQQGCCAICGKHQSELKDHLVLDHDHFTKEIRALLCAYCNLRVVGKLRKDTIQKVYDYLNSPYTGWFVPSRKRKCRKKKKKQSKVGVSHV